MSIWHSCNGQGYNTWTAPNVTGLTPNASIHRTTSLYGSHINLSLTIYQRPVNATFKEILRVVNGNTNIDSNNRCISYGVSFQFWGSYPIKNTTATGNGGCDAILGSECSQSIHRVLKQSFDSINELACGVNPDILLDSLRGCPPHTTNSVIIRSNFLTNGTFVKKGLSPSNPSKPWIYHQSEPSVNNEYDETMKYFVFIYFVGRPYSSGIIDSAIACLST